MSKSKVLITKREWEMYEYGYGKYRRTGKPSLAMHTVEFDTREEAEAFKNKKDAEYHEASSTTIELLN